MHTSLSSPLLIVPLAVEETFHQGPLVVVIEGAPLGKPLEVMSPPPVLSWLQVGIHSSQGQPDCLAVNTGGWDLSLDTRVGSWYTDKRLSGNSFKREPFIGDFFW